MPSARRESIHIPVDVAANVEGNRLDLSLNELPVEAPILDLGVQSTINLRPQRKLPVKYPS